MLHFRDLDVFKGLGCVFFFACVCLFKKDGRKFKITSWMIVFFEGFEFDVILEWLNWWLFPTKSDDDDDNDGVRDNRIALVDPCHFITLGLLDQDFDPVFGGLNPSKPHALAHIGLVCSLHYGFPMDWTAGSNI